MRTFARVNGRLALVGTQTMPDETAHACEQAPLRFSPTETNSLELLRDDAGSTIDAVKAALETAEALVAPNRDFARLAVIAKAIAQEQERHHSLATLHDQLVCGNPEALGAIARALTESTKRLCKLVAEHRACCHVGQRAAIVVGHAERVHVTTEK